MNVTDSQLLHECVKRSGRSLVFKGAHCGRRFTDEGDDFARLRIRVRKPTELLDTGMYYARVPIIGVGGNPGRTYDVSPDDRRLMIKAMTPDSQAAAPPPTITVALNWFEELKRFRAELDPRAVSTSTPTLAVSLQALVVCSGPKR